jgi:hypothetical protein
MRCGDGEKLDERLGPIFQRVFYLVEELMGDGTVYDAMVVAERDVAHRADGDGIVNDDRTLFDGAEPEDTDVGLADDREAEESAVRQDR